MFFKKSTGDEDNLFNFNFLQLQFKIYPQLSHPSSFVNPNFSKFSSRYFIFACYVATLCTTCQIISPLVISQRKVVPFHFYELFIFQFRHLLWRASWPSQFASSSVVCLPFPSGCSKQNFLLCFCFFIFHIFFFSNFFWGACTLC